MKSVFIMLVTIFWSVAALAGNNKFSTHLYAKFQTKGCTTCHDFFEKERQGLAFASHRERSVEMCIICHQKGITGFEHQEEWFAMPGLYRSGMDAKQTCESMKTALNAKFKSKLLLKRQLEKHLFEDPRVLWGIEGATPQSGMLPGGKKEADLVKGGFPLWKEQVNAWIEAGMECE